MKYLFTISLRNLLRQKRRNILLGSAMAIGMMLLIMANSFSHGISDIVFNKILRWAAGHAAIVCNERGNVYLEVCRDKEKMIDAVRPEIRSGIVTKYDEALGTLVRAVGNGKSDNTMLIGIDTASTSDEKERKEIEESFKLIQGSWDSLSDKTIENPAIMSKEKAEYLNVKVNDVVRLRFRNIYQQDQAARITVTGIMQNENIFMQSVTFITKDNAKAILGYKPHETGSIYLTLKNPRKDAAGVADRIHKRLLSPDYMVILATASCFSRTAPAIVIGYKTDTSSITLLNLIKTDSKDTGDVLSKNACIVSSNISEALKLKPGSEIAFTYENAYDSGQTTAKFKITSIFEPDINLPSNTVILNENKLCPVYYENKPKQYKMAISETNPWKNILTTEYVLLPRTKDTDALKKKYREIGKKKLKTTVVDVRTMYEMASDILKLEGVLNLITFSAVMVLFFIILLGVVNTLRMTIRERTKEIGTMRAIGMQKNDIKYVFILETFFLSLFSAFTGFLLSLAAMWGLSKITINLSNNPMDMFLIKKHLYFLPSYTAILFYLALIILIAVVTAYFPSKRAANLSPASALRHYD